MLFEVCCSYSFSAVVVAVAVVVAIAVVVAVAVNVAIAVVLLQCDVTSIMCSLNSILI